MIRTSRDRWSDFKASYHCVDFSQLPLLNDTVTELLISPSPDFRTECQRLPVRTTSSSNIDYSAFRKTILWFYSQEYPRRIRYSSYIGIGHRIELSEVNRCENLADGVDKVRTLRNEGWSVYKGVDKLIYVPHDTDVLEQELRHLELFRGNKSIVQLIAGVVSTNSYQTLEHDIDKPPILRGFLLEYHPSGTLRDLLQSPQPWVTK